jgi:hypothetical protein
LLIAAFGRKRAGGAGQEGGIQKGGALKNRIWTLGHAGGANLNAAPFDNMSGIQD